MAPASLPPLFRALRPHQWAKNALLVLPALAAHLPWTPSLGLALFEGVAAFCLMASGLYLVNDVLDLRNDRLHPTKSRRPLASGQVSVPAALAVAGLLVLAATALGGRLPVGGRWALTAYAAGSLAYSLDLKRRPVLDVIVLATLYATRVVAGAETAHVPLSRWFLAFALFLFLSLALVKRVVELQGLPKEATGFARGRCYVRADVPALVALGAACTAASALVYCLYVTSEDVGRLYRHPDLLWAGLPLILYWQARIWLVANRGDMHEDPVVFALRDGVGYLVLAAMSAIVLVAR